MQPLRYRPSSSRGRRRDPPLPRRSEACHPLTAPEPTGPRAKTAVSMDSHRALHRLLGETTGHAPVEQEPRARPLGSVRSRSRQGGQRIREGRRRGQRQGYAAARPELTRPADQVPPGPVRSAVQAIPGEESLPAEHCEARRHQGGSPAVDTPAGKAPAADVPPADIPAADTPGADFPAVAVPAAACCPDCPAERHAGLAPAPSNGPVASPARGTADHAAEEKTAAETSSTEHHAALPLLPRYAGHSVDGV